MNNLAVKWTEGYIVAASDGNFDVVCEETDYIDIGNFRRVQVLVQFSSVNITTTGPAFYLESALTKEAMSRDGLEETVDSIAEVDATDDSCHFNLSDDDGSTPFYRYLRWRFAHVASCDFTIKFKITLLLKH